MLMKIWSQHKKRAPKEQREKTKSNNLLNGMYVTPPAIFSCTVRSNIIVTLTEETNRSSHSDTHQ